MSCTPIEMMRHLVRISDRVRGGIHHQKTRYIFTSDTQQKVIVKIETLQE
jgi:hypothetical protein